MDSRMTYKVFGNTGHLGNYYATTQEDVLFMNGNNNGYHPQGGQTWNQHPYDQGGNQGISFNPNQPSLKDLVFGQAKINDGFNKKLVACDKALESLNTMIDSLSSAFKSQLSFNKMIETQLARLAALVPSTEDRKISGQPVSSCEDVGVLSTTWDKPSRRIRPTNYAGKPVIQVLDPWDSSAVVHPGYLSITCIIYYRKIRNTLCDLGASVNLMSKNMCEKLGYLALSPTSKIVQLADATIWRPEGMVKSLLVFVQGSCIYNDFVVLDMQNNAEMPLILGRSFLSDANTRIIVGME
jgi:hypothetical protein